MIRSGTGNLFGETEPTPTGETLAPLAERMRPFSLDEFVGQRQLVGEGRILPRLLASGGTMPSLVLWAHLASAKPLWHVYWPRKLNRVLLRYPRSFLASKTCARPSPTPGGNEGLVSAPSSLSTKYIALIKDNKMRCCTLWRMAPSL